MEWFKKLGLNFKIALGVIASIAIFALYLFIQGKISARQKLKYELEKVKREQKLVELEKDQSLKEDKVRRLEEKELAIRDKIREVENREFQGEEVPVSELDDFFKDRGLL